MASAEALEEQEALLAICGDTMEVLEPGSFYRLSLVEEQDEAFAEETDSVLKETCAAANLLMQLPEGYPDMEGPQVVAVEHMHELLGEADLDKVLADDVLASLWTPGNVCVYDMKLRIRELLSEEIKGKRKISMIKPQKEDVLPVASSLAVATAASSSNNSNLDFRWSESHFRRGKYGERHLSADLSRYEPFQSALQKHQIVNIKASAGGKSTVPVLLNNIPSSAPTFKFLEIHHSIPFTEMKSTFQAHIVFSRSSDDVDNSLSSVEDVHQILMHLYLDKHFDAGTHNIWAYRIFDRREQLSSRHTSPSDHVKSAHEYDDDGEAMAGKKIAELLELAIDGRDIPGILVVVSRWFGGTLMGPSRFKAFNRAAQRLLDDLGLRKN